MKLLIHTQYFPPEVGAPQNRLFELALRLQALGVDVTVLTAMPNYPQMEIQQAYQGKSYVYEEMQGLKVHRASIYVSKSRSIAKRLLNYFSFVRTSYKVGRQKLDNTYDFVLCESPPLFLGIAAQRLARKKQAKFIFNVSDLWPESAEKLGLIRNPVFLRMARELEESLYRNAALITGQTQGIVADISGRFPNKPVYWLPNGVDLNFYDAKKIHSEWRKENAFAKEDIIFLYAGIIGHAQGLEVVLNAAAQLQNQPHLKFVLMGSGPCKTELQEMAKRLQLQNLTFKEAVTKAEMPAILKAVDVALVPLKKLDLFKGAIPSKIFENLAMEVPLLLGVEGEAKTLFIDEAEAGEFFEPENADALAGAALKMANTPGHILKLGKNGAAYVAQKFNRDKIAEAFYRELIKLT